METEKAEKKTKDEITNQTTKQSISKYKQTGNSNAKEAITETN